MRTILLLTLLAVAGCSSAVATTDPALVPEPPCNDQIQEAVAKALESYRDRAAGVPAGADAVAGGAGGGTVVPEPPEVVEASEEPELTPEPPDLFSAFDEHEEHHAEILRLESRIAELEDGDECNPLEGWTGMLYVGAEWCPPCRPSRGLLQGVYIDSVGLASGTIEADFDKHPWAAKIVGDSELPLFVVFVDGVEKRRMSGKPASKEAIWRFYMGDKTTPYPTTTSYGSSSNGSYASTSWVPVVGAPAPGGGVVVSVSGGGCPCGCNGQCGGQCGCPDCPCGNANFRPPTPTNYRTTATSNRGAFPNFKVNGQSARSASYATLAGHATGSHGMNVAGMSRNDIGWALYEDHRRNGWGSGAHRGSRRSAAPTRRSSAGRSIGGLFSGWFGRRSCPPGGCP